MAQDGYHGKNAGIRQFVEDNFTPALWKDGFSWRLCDVILKNKKGDVMFDRRGIEVPAHWSDMAAQVVVEKYLVKSGPLQEHSVAERVHRVIGTIAAKGYRLGYFEGIDDARGFYVRLCKAVIEQKFAFNSPVWFNVGVHDEPQCSACFISSVGDSMEDIASFQTAEYRLFKMGSGSGANLSALRGSKEPLSLGGTASGPDAFMRGLDASAGAMKSGGTTRRAAKMVILDDDHPDVMRFINTKVVSEKAAHALIDAGFSAQYDDPEGAYGLVPYQNANHSLRVSDEFLSAVQGGEKWALKNRRDGSVASWVDAVEMWRAVAKAAWFCADPGIQFDSTIHKWHPCKKSGRQRGSNPCSEFIFLDDTSCNLSSINLIKFIKENSDGQFDFDANGFCALIDDVITAMDITVSLSSYPTEKIAQGTHDFRTLGLGYTNLGGMLMSLGIPYDSDEGRAVCAVVTSLMGSRAYLRSHQLAEKLGSFPMYEKNASDFADVMNLHKKASRSALDDFADADEVCISNLTEMYSSAHRQWCEVAKAHGFRNAQVTVLAPTGTISFMMDSATTGIEPEFGLVKWKNLTGGETVVLVNPLVESALNNLGYKCGTSAEIAKYVVDHYGDIKSCPLLARVHVDVFACANEISPMGHMKMMAAAQPFLSGAISKTINMDELATVEEIEQCYMDAHALGLKCVAIYRNNCKRSQPLTAEQKAEKLGGDTPVCHYCGSHRTYRRGRCIACADCGQSSSCS